MLIFVPFLLFGHHELLVKCLVSVLCVGRPSSPSSPCRPAEKHKASLVFVLLRPRAAPR